jgi:hypothetical protein
LKEFYYLIILFSILLSLNCSTKKNVEDENLFFIQDNPYQILGIAPWSNYKKIEKKYKFLKNKYKNNIKKTIKINNAYKKLKARYEKGNLNTFLSITLRTFMDIISLIICYYIYKIILHLFQSFTKFCFKFVFFHILFFIIIDNFASYVFFSFYSELFISFIFGTTIYVIMYIIGYYMGNPSIDWSDEELDFIRNYLD